MSWRQRVRSVTRRLPVTSAYERRIVELTGEVEHLTGEIHQLAERLHAAEHGALGGAGVWVPPGHFYSPIPDLDDLRRRHDAVFGAPVDQIAGVDLRLVEQWALLDTMAPLAEGVEFAATADDAIALGHRYWAENPSFNVADALALTMILRHHRPARLIELGCGFSSACTLDVRDRDLDGWLDLTFVDPYLDQFDQLVPDHERSAIRRIDAPTQDVPLDVFRELRAGDVLFVDSTHVARTGSDVNRIVFEILPALAPGVLIHVHDVFPGFEYPEPWVYESRAWSEQYLLRAFLQFNPAFRIHWWPALLRRVADDDQRARFPVLERLQGGSLWLERVE